MIDRDREVVECARLHETFEHALVDETQVDLFAQREERVDPPLFRADSKDGRDGAFADVLDRPQAEADPS